MMSQQHKPLHIIFLGNGVEYIGEYAFQCSGITSIVLPNSIKEFGHRPFSDCSRLERAVLPASNFYLNGYTFAWCSNLREVTIPEGCTRLCYSMFLEDRKIESVYLPATLVEIGENCFNGCSSLSSAIFADPENWYVGGTSMPKEILQDEEVAARKLIALTESNWEHRTSN